MGACAHPPNLSIITQFVPRGSLFRLLHRRAPCTASALLPVPVGEVKPLLFICSRLYVQLSHLSLLWQ